MGVPPSLFTRSGVGRVLKTFACTYKSGAVYGVSEMVWYLRMRRALTFYLPDAQLQKVSIALNSNLLVMQTHQFQVCAIIAGKSYGDGISKFPFTCFRPGFSMPGLDSERLSFCLVETETSVSSIFSLQ